MNKPIDERNSGVKYFEYDIHLGEDDYDNYGFFKIMHQDGLGAVWMDDFDAFLQNTRKMTQFIEVVDLWRKCPYKIDKKVNKFHITLKQAKVISGLADIIMQSEFAMADMCYHPYIEAALRLSEVNCLSLVNFVQCIGATNLRDGYVDRDFYIGINFGLKEYFDLIVSNAIVRKIEGIKRNMRKNSHSIVEHFSNLMSRHATLLVVRIDLGYSAKSHPQFPSENQQAIAISDRRRFFNEIKKNYPDWLGFVWKLEFASRKGYHYHAILYFDGERLRADAKISLALAHLWERVTGYNQGVTFLCNLHKQRYRHPAIGSIHYKEKEKIENFKFIADYLSKSDIVCCLRAKRQRTMGKSKIPEMKIKKGRPRASDLREG